MAKARQKPVTPKFTDKANKIDSLSSADGSKPELDSLREARKLEIAQGGKARGRAGLAALREQLKAQSRTSAGKKTKAASPRRAIDPKGVAEFNVPYTGIPSKKQQPQLPR